MATNEKLLEHELVGQLQGLQATLVDLKRERTLRTAVGAGGFVLIMGVVLNFMANLHDYATQYPADDLTRALGREAETLVGSPQTLMLGQTLRQQAANTLLPAVSKQAQADMPKFQQEIQAMFQDLEAFLNNEISQRAAQQLLMTANSIHSELLREYGHLPVDGIEKATAAAQTEYLRQLPQLLNQRLQQSAGNLRGLQDSLTQLARDPEYATLQQASPEQLERNFYIAILEMAADNLKREAAQQSTVTAAQTDKQGV